MSPVKQALFLVVGVIACGAVSLLDLNSAVVDANVTQEQRLRALEASRQTIADWHRTKPQAAPMLNPVCPDQYIAQRGAGERWRGKCLTVSTEGSRVLGR